MNNFTQTTKLILILAFLSNLTFVSGQSLASYDITFNSVWENEIIDPVNGNSIASIPGNAHWSNLVGTTHNSNYTMVEMGTLASTGIKNVAELGNNTALMAEVNAQISAGNANQWLQEGFSPFAAISSATISDVTVSSDYPLLSLASMIAPSPDWMISVNAINLRDGNNWRTSITIPLFPYDAGTDSGANYSSANLPTVPAVPISSLINSGPFNSNPIGTLTVTLNQVLSVDENAIENVSIYPNPSDGAFTVKSKSSNPVKSIQVYDVLGKLTNSTQNKSLSTDYRLNLSNLDEGVYMLRITYQNGLTSVNKVIIN